jgi:signal transduction histidine kinase/DNA-binding NarL/FixJ family response regulator
MKAVGENAMPVPPVIRVLLVEDNPADARFIRTMIDDARRSAADSTRFELRQVERLSTAVEQLLHEAVGVVLLDLSLPDSQGLETLVGVCAAAPEVPVVVLTGLDDEATAMQAVHAGAQDYLIKGEIDRHLLVRSMRYAMERQRLKAQAEQEARLAGALAEIGREMISALSTPVLLDRLCRLTASALGCDFSHTWLWQPKEKAYAPVAGHGFTPEQWESLRLIRMPRATVEQLRTEDVVQVVMVDHPDRRMTALARQFGVTVVLYGALRRGGELIGMQTSGYFGRREPLSSEQLRLARGVASLASMALENARLFEQLEHANRIKSNFVATMSHELRTPLNTIMGYTELLIEGNYGDMQPQQIAVMKSVSHSAEELRDVITAALDLSRLEARPVPLELQEVSLAELIHDVETEMREQYAKVDVRLVSECATDLPPIQTDRVKLKMVLKNLVGNAMKFTERGTVTVGARRRDAGIEVSCSDTGIGIPPEAQLAIFDPFRQADESIAARYGGAGLGLYIVRRLLEMLGGTVAVESEVGRGSTFRVWIPLVAKGVT